MLISQNTVISNTVSENITVTASATLDIRGITCGQIKVSEKSTCILHGIHNGNFFVDELCALVIHGTLNGNIVNSGKTEIFGSVKNSHITGKSLIIHKNAIVNNKHYSSDETL